MKRWLLLAVVIAAACADPVHNARVDALGGETGDGPGPTHRPGQPCLTCHGGGGPAKAQFVVAGTIYQLQDPTSPPMAGLTVSILDATKDGTPHTAVTNEAGNFYIRAENWTPVFPLHDITLSIEGSQNSPVMNTVMGRDGSCATCHYDPASRSTPGHVYFASDPTDLPGGGGGGGDTDAGDADGGAP